MTIANDSPYPVTTSPPAKRALKSSTLDGDAPEESTAAPFSEKARRSNDSRETQVWLVLDLALFTLFNPVGACGVAYNLIVLVLLLFVLLSSLVSLDSRSFTSFLRVLFISRPAMKR